MKNIDLILNSTGREMLKLFSHQRPNIESAMNSLANVVNRGANPTLMLRAIAHRFKRTDPSFSLLTDLLVVEPNVRATHDLSQSVCQQLIDNTVNKFLIRTRQDGAFEFEVVESQMRLLLSKLKLTRKANRVNVVDYLQIHLLHGFLQGLVLSKKFGVLRGLPDDDADPTVIAPVYNDSRNDPRVLKSTEEYAKRGWRSFIIGYDSRHRNEDHFYQSEPGRDILVLQSLKCNALTSLARLKDSEGQFRASQLYIAGASIACVLNADRFLARKILIHTHDMHVLISGKLLVETLRNQSRKTVVWLHDYHELVTGLEFKTPERGIFFIGDEQQISGLPNINITVSDALAKSLESLYGIEPLVVYNSLRSGFRDIKRRYDSIRHIAPIPKDAEVLIYSGNVSAQRRVHLPLYSLTQEENLHYAIITSDTPRSNLYLASLLDEASTLGIQGRIHLFPYVEPDNAWELMCGATAVLSMLPRYPNGDIALPNKLFDALKAGVPVLSSDNPEMSRFISEESCGQIFRADDEVDFLRAYRHLLNHPPHVDPNTFERYAWDRRFAHVISDVESVLSR